MQKENIISRLREIEEELVYHKNLRDSFKLSINGSYGKFGSKYSFLFSPDLLIQTTITGQLALLMLIEQVELAGAEVMSANTDGIVVKCGKDIETNVVATFQSWELDTNFELERTDYKALYSRDVNNYIAVKHDGSAKGKGMFAETGLMKNPAAPICYEAAVKYITSGVSVGETVRLENDFTKFITARSVKGGGVYDGQELGKVVRWYYGLDCEGKTINYKTNGNKVPKSDGSIPCMDLPDGVPSDLNYSWYIRESVKILESIGVDIC